MELKIEYIAIDRLQPYENNTRKHSDADVAKIMQSISRYGFSDPVGVWSDDLLIVEGHGRVEAANKLGMTEVPVIRLDHLSDEQRREYAIAHNRTAEFSGWDWAKLEQEMAELDFGDFDLEFNTGENATPDFDDLFVDAEEKKEKEPKRIQCPHCGEWFDAE